MQYIAVCHTCRHQHRIEFDPKVGAGNAFSDWYTKHPPGHITEFRFPRRRQKDGTHTPPKRWAGYLHNADIQVAYAASSSALSTGLDSLAASSTLLVGYESNAVDNGASVKYLDYLAAGNYTAAASNNQAGAIYTCVVGAKDDTPTFPLPFDGTASAETVPDSGTFNSICKILSAIGADNTASQVWYWGPCSVAALFGGWIPDQFVYFVTQNIQTSSNAWHTTGNDISHIPMYATST